MPLRALLTAFVLAAPSAAGMVQREPVDANREGARVSRPSSADAALAISGALRRSRESGADAEELVTAILEHGPEAIEPLLTLLCEQVVLAVADDDPPQILSAPQRALVLGALSELPAGEVCAAIEARLRDEPGADVRLAAVRALGAVGSAADFARLDKLLPRDGDGRLPRTNREALRQAYAQLLVRDPRVFSSIGDIVSRADAAVVQELLFALADSRDPRALAVCFSVARDLPALTQAAVAIVPRLARSNDAEIENRFAAWLRAHVDPRRAEWTRAVNAALAELDEGEAVPLWLEALEGQDRNQRESALAGLRKLSGLSLAADVPRWKMWFAREFAWFERHRQADQQLLSAGDPALVIEALRSYSEHRIFRNVLAEDVAPVLQSAHPALRRMACQTLASLGSRAALPALARTLDDADPSVVREARAALAAISGCELPQDSAGIRARLFPDA